jgi:hypothetical protein
MSLTTTPRLLALVRMREECKCSGRVSVAINNDRYRRMMVVVVVVVLMVVM